MFREQAALQPLLYARTWRVLPAVAENLDAALAMEHLRLGNLLGRRAVAPACLDRLQGRSFGLGVLNGRWRVAVAPAETTEATTLSDNP